MADRFLPHALLPDFLRMLGSFGELHGPTLLENDVTAFAPISDADELRLDYRRTQIPPKKYLIPFRETILSYRNGAYEETVPDAPAVVLFGVHPCDLRGIAYLDLVFLSERDDTCYAKRRERLTLIGLSCEPDDYCFCEEPGREAPCDLFMTRTDEGFVLTPFSPKGEALMEAGIELLQPMGNEPHPHPRPPLEREGASPMLPECESPMLPQDPELRFSDNPLWQKFAETCVSCGACSACCPTCYCFEVREYPDLATGGIRMREWDNCLFKTHGEVAGGVNFRKTRLERLRYRFLHKYCGFSPLQGVISCVGCGRCKEVCPVDIDLREIFSSPPKV